MINKTHNNWTAKTLANQVNKGKINFECAVQRGHVWDNEKSSLLIHSMIEGYPIPAFYFAKSGDGTYDALDGKQRCTAITNFLNNQLKLSETLENVTNEDGGEVEIAEKTYDELPEWAQDAIKDYSFLIYYFEGLSVEERDTMFFRLNNGKPLTAIELTRVKAKSLKMFQEIAEHELVKLAVTEKGRIKYNHENLAMQAWAICYADDVAFDTKTFRNIVENAEVEQAHVNSIMEYFDILLEIHGELDENDKAQKRLAKRIITRTHTVSLTRAVHEAKTIGMNNEDFKEWVKEYFNGKKSATNDETYNNSVGAGSARKDKVDARINTIIDNMKKYIRDDKIRSKDKLHNDEVSEIANTAENVEVDAITAENEHEHNATENEIEPVDDEYNDLI